MLLLFLTQIQTEPRTTPDEREREREREPERETSRSLHKERVSDFILKKRKTMLCLRCILALGIILFVTIHHALLLSNSLRFCVFIITMKSTQIQAEPKMKIDNPIQNGAVHLLQNMVRYINVTIHKIRKNEHSFFTLPK